MKKLFIAVLIAMFAGSSMLCAAETAVMSSTAGSTPEDATSAAVAPAKTKKIKKQKKTKNKAKKTRRHR